MSSTYGKWISSLLTGALIAAAPCAWSAPPDLRAGAEAAALGLGKVMQVKDGAVGILYLFEENHVSRAGQIEIAHMLVRLYRDQRLRTIGLEGFTGDKLRAPWAERINAKDRRMQVAGRLLGDGELSSAEFMAVAYSDIRVVGIDGEKDYQVEVSQRAGAAPLFYMLLIAEKTMPEASKKKFNDLLEEKKQQEAFDFAINGDPWTKRKFEEGRSRKQRESVDAQIAYLDSIEGEAKRRAVQIPAELEQNMQDLRAFYMAADRRSDTMVERLALLAKSGPPIAGIIGAAHTEKMVRLLAKRGVAFAVVRPNALVGSEAAPADPGEMAGYERKLRGLPVDEKGLGALLKTKRKPPPSLVQPWLEQKAGVYDATASVVDSVLVNQDRPPYRFAANLPAGYAVDPKTVSVVDGEVVFALRTPGAADPIWVRAARSSKVTDVDKRRADIDERIKRLLGEAESADSNGPPNKPPRPPRPTAEGPEPPGGGRKGTPREGTVRLAPDIYARFSKNEEIAKKESALMTAL